MPVSSRVYTETDVEAFFDQTLNNYLSFWDSQGALHTGYFAGEADHDCQAARRRLRLLRLPPAPGGDQRACPQARLRPGALERRLLAGWISGCPGGGRLRDPPGSQPREPSQADLPRPGKDGAGALTDGLGGRGP